MRDLVDELLQAKVKARLFGGDHAPRLGRLVILDRIGSGAMGTVFAAYDPRLDRKVAVKLVKSEGADATAAVLREARALGKLAHPNVVAVYDADAVVGAVYIVMELAPGVPLRAWIGGAHPWREVVRVMREAAAGIAAAHRAGLVHRDIKPDNILIGDDRARVVDLGLAHDLAGDAGSSTAGTPTYMAPEVLAGGAPSAAADQFSFGVTLFEALHGVRPHLGATREELRETARLASRAAPAATRSAVPAWVHAIAQRALAARPEDRFASMDDVVSALGRDRRRHRQLAVAAAALVVGAAAGGFAYRHHAAADPCGGAEARIAAAWSPATAAQVRTRLGTAPWAATAAGALDTAAGRWAASYRHVCEATRVRGEQSDTLLDLRMRCLDRALDRFGALATALAAPLDAAARAEAAPAIAALPPAADCETLSDPGELALPAAPAQRARVVAAEHALDDAAAAYYLARYRDARARVAAVEHATRDLDVAPLRAQLLLLAGAVEARIGEPATARARLLAALQAAATAHANELEVEVWSRLLRQELFAGDPAAVIDDAPFALAAAARAGREGAELQGIVGEALRDAGQLAAARTRLRAALGSRDPLRADQRAVLEMNAGSVELAAGDPVAAEAAFVRALDLARAALGEGHPSLALYLDKLAAADRARGRLRAALARHAQSLALRRAAFGDADRAVASSLLQRGRTLIEAGQLAVATRDLTTARALRVQAYGATSPRLGEIDAALGDAALAAGDRAAARAAFERAAAADPRLELASRLLQAGAPVAIAAFPTAIDPLSVDRAVAIAVRVALLPRDQGAQVAAALHVRWRAAGAAVDPALSLAVADALAATGDRAGAGQVAQAALGQLADEPSRLRLRALTLLAHTLDGTSATAAAAGAASLAAQLPELAR